MILPFVKNDPLTGSIQEAVNIHGIRMEVTSVSEFISLSLVLFL